jgi:glycosyltransferase involved in cell wall biosynthesis
MDVASVLRDVSVLVLPSVVPETFGRVLVEAMAAGVPCISTDFGGQSEVIEHEKTGLLVPGFDAKAISNAIVRLLGDKQFYCRIAEAGRKKVEHEYRLETMCERTMDVYAELCTPRQDIL